MTVIAVLVSGLTCSELNLLTVTGGKKSSLINAGHLEKA